MKKKSLELVYEHYENLDECPANIRSLVFKSRDAASDAYAPYSNFKVGAVIEDESGAFYTGNNQENAAYPDGICAERVAIWTASSQNSGLTISSIAISSSFNGSSILSPCGSCRQVMIEREIHQKNPVRIILDQGKAGIIVFQSVKELLPLSFSKLNLNET